MAGLINSINFSIQIDFREKDILKYCTEMNKDKDIEIKTENLLLGDILINKLLIERKTINDLAASIVDGRYKEQSFRLLKALEEGFKVFYFIEGNMDLYTGAISKNTLVSTIYSLTNKGFQVLLTKNSKETSFFILQFAEKMKRIEKDEKRSTQKSYSKDRPQRSLSANQPLHSNYGSFSPAPGKKTYKVIKSEPLDKPVNTKPKSKS